jgi:hypothetical protein
MKTTTRMFGRFIICGLSLKALKAKNPVHARQTAKIIVKIESTQMSVFDFYSPEGAPKMGCER